MRTLLCLPALLFLLLTPCLSAQNEAPGALAKSYGLVSKAPKDADAVVAFYGIDEVRQSFLKSAFWDSLLSLSELAEEDLSFDGDDFPEEATEILEELFGDQVCLIMGDGSADAFSRLLRFSRLNDKMTYKTLGSAGLGAGMGGLADLQNGPDLGAIFDPSLFIHAADLLDGFEIPRMTLLCSTEDALALHAKIPEPSEEDLEEGMVLGSFQNAHGHEVVSYTMEMSQILTKKQKRQILRDLPEDQKDGVSSLLDTVSKLKFVVSYGPIDKEHYAFTIGPDAKQETLAANPAESILALEQVGFAGQWSEKNLFNFTYLSEEFGNALETHHPASPLLEAIAEVLEETEGMEAVAARLAPRLQALVKDGDELMKFEKVTAMVGVGFWEDGFRWEGQGGPETAGYDLSKPLRLKPPANAFIAVQNRSLAGHTRKSWKYVEALVATLYEGANVFAEMQGGADNPEVAQGMAMAQMVVPSIDKIYGKVRSALGDGLGEEGMFVLDFDGAMPQVPELPADLLEKAKVPRLALVYPVKDRAILAKSWKEIPPIANDLFESMGSPARVPSTMSSDSDGLRTHFFPLPYLSDDVLPSASVSDELFILGTSKNLATTIAGAPEAKNGESGSLFRVNFEPLQEYWDLWAGLADEQEDMQLEEEEKEAFLMLRQWLGALHQIDSRTWKEGDDLRSSFHLEFSDIPANN